MCPYGIPNKNTLQPSLAIFRNYFRLVVKRSLAERQIELSFKMVFSSIQPNQGWQNFPANFPLWKHSRLAGTLLGRPCPFFARSLSS